MKYRFSSLRSPPLAFIVILTLYSGVATAFSAGVVSGGGVASYLSLPKVNSFTPSVGGAPGASSFKPLCLSTSNSGPRLQAIYAYDSVKGISTSKMAKIRQIMQETDRIVFLSADKQGGGRRLRMATEKYGSSCRISVIAIPVLTAALNSGVDSILHSALIAKRIIANNTLANPVNLGIIPVAFFDSDPKNYSRCGLGIATGDDTVNGSNSEPQSRQASIWGSCWNAFSAVHEIMHVLGAVQASAPNSTGNGHCNDGIDPLCYSDGGPNSTQKLVCPSTPYRPGGLLDCNADDYFAVAPPAGTYLSDHFNIANNSPYVESVPYSNVSWPTVDVNSISVSAALPFTGVPFTANVQVPGGFLFAGSSYTNGNDHCGVRLLKTTDLPPTTSLFSISGVAYCRTQYSVVKNPNDVQVFARFLSQGAFFSLVDQMGRDTAGEVKFQFIKTTAVYQVKDTQTITKPSSSNGGNFLVTLTLKGKGPQSTTFDIPLVGLQYQVLDQTTMKTIPADGKSNREVTSEPDGTMNFIFPAKLRGHLIDLENDGLDGNVNWNLKITQFKLP